MNQTEPQVIDNFKKQIAKLSIQQKRDLAISLENRLDVLRSE